MPGGGSIASGSVSFGEPLYWVMLVLSVILSGLFLYVWWHEDDDRED